MPRPIRFDDVPVPPQPPSTVPWSGLPPVQCPADPPRDSRALASVIIGAIGVACPVGLGVVALVLARNVRRDVDTRGGRSEDRDLASIGAALGWAGILIPLALFLIVAVFFLVTTLIVGGGAGAVDGLAAG